MWVSDVLPGHVHDLAAARENVLPVLRKYIGEMPGLADCGFEGAGHGVLTPVKKPGDVNPNWIWPVFRDGNEPFWA
jgi:hypothetical protein